MNKVSKRKTKHYSKKQENTRKVNRRCRQGVAEEPLQAPKASQADFFLKALVPLFVCCTFSQFSICVSLFLLTFSFLVLSFQNLRKVPQRLFEEKSTDEI